MESLYDKYGGLITITQLVRLFYQKLLDSPLVAHYFENINLNKLMEHQTNFIIRLLGGPDVYSGRDLKAAHANLGITEADLTEVVELLDEALVEMEVEPDDITAILDVIGQHKDQIVGV